MEETFEDMSVPELLALHVKLDGDIAFIRETQGTIDALVSRKEKAAEVPGDPALTQGVTHG